MDKKADLEVRPLSIPRKMLRGSGEGGGGRGSHRESGIEETVNSTSAGMEGFTYMREGKPSRKLLEVSLDWMGGVCSEARMRGHLVLIDSSREEGGEDRGPAPTEIFLASLGSCIMVNISRIAQKMKLDLKGVHMDVKGVKEYNGHPSSFITLDVDISIKADSRDREKLERLIRLAEENCTVSNTLRNAVKPNVRLQLIGPTSV